jgi:hypothetical protein
LNLLELRHEDRGLALHLDKALCAEIEAGIVRMLEVETERDLITVDGDGIGERGEGNEGE